MNESETQSSLAIASVCLFVTGDSKGVTVALLLDGSVWEWRIRPGYGQISERLAVAEEHIGERGLRIELCRISPMPNPVA